MALGFTTLPSVRDIWQLRGHVLNGYVSMASPAAAELYAAQGWDTVTLDLEHGSIGFDAAVEILRAIRGSGVVPLVRVPKGDPTWVATLLDAGAMGITAAMIDTREDAQRLVDACRYPPLGDRGLSRQTRAAMLHGLDYTETANTRISVFAMVETVEGMRNLSSIASVPGLDGIYFGGVDFEMSLRRAARGDPAGAGDTAAATASARKAVVEACRANSILAGMNASNPAAALALFESGFRFITLSSDAVAMTSQARAWVTDARRLVTTKA